MARSAWRSGRSSPAYCASPPWASGPLDHLALGHRRNLSVHLRKLEEAGYVAIEKSFGGRKPRTRISLTEHGRTAFDFNLDAIGKLVESR